eukprot:scaffold20073_cov94-Isochrysis_galbana.AAC.2
MPATELFDGSHSTKNSCEQLAQPESGTRSVRRHKRKSKNIFAWRKTSKVGALESDELVADEPLRYTKGPGERAGGAYVRRYWLCSAAAGRAE